MTPEQEKHFKEQVRLGNESFAVLEKKRDKFKKSWLRKKIGLLILLLKHKITLLF